MPQKQNKNKISKEAIFVVPMLALAMVMGGFGGSFVSGIRYVGSNIASIAAGLSGYGCGTYGQSNPVYGGDCTTSSSSSTVVSSSVTTSSSTTTSSSVASTNPTISAKVYLSANFNDTTDTMGIALRTANYIPTAQPYTIAPFNYAGTETAATIPATTVDWVLMDIRNSAGTSIQQKAVLLNNDGSLVDPATLSNNIVLSNITAAANYKVVIKHRNHIAIATNTDITLTPGTNSSVDFTNNANVRLSNQVQIGTNSSSQPVYGMYKGNVTGDTAISAADRNSVRNAQVAVGYYSNDADLSGNISAADRNLVRNAQVANEAL
jgi:hypothetical protein